MNTRSPFRSLTLALTMATLLLSLATPTPARSESSARAVADFQTPPAAARPWVFWFWINGNVSKEGITADLEAMNRVGIGGVLWMEVSGPWWAPDGKVVPLSEDWHDAFQWAIRECQRLGLQFDATLDFGYGSGGPHITPDRSMQKLYWSETQIAGGAPADLTLPKPTVERKVTAWLRPGVEMNPKVMGAIDTIDSYRDVAVFAFPTPPTKEARAYRIPDLDRKNGLGFSRVRSARDDPAPPPGAVLARDAIVDLTTRMDRDGRLRWDPPPGPWTILRIGHASNFKMTRPSPWAAVGLECDRLSRAGIDTHFDAFLKPIIQRAGDAAGRSLAYAHIDSWEAGGQNWTESFPAEFRARRGYDIRPWLPALAGRAVGSPELSERFLWDVRTTVGELIRDNYAKRLRDLVRPHGLGLSIEAYGHLCIDNLGYAGVADMPVSEFWARGDQRFPDLLAGRGGYAFSSKAMASAAHTGGKRFVGAEAFTSDRAWRDHPSLLKPMGDWAFCQGVNRMIFHLYAHQPYEEMVPGLTHRKWGEHFNRFNTWWTLGRAWITYLSRCQQMLQHGIPVADVCYWFGEGAPLTVDDMRLDLPAGYDYDLCSSDTVASMEVRDGLIHLPSGLVYRYLHLPDTDRMTLPMARKIERLVADGARVIGGRRPRGTPGLTDHPRADAELQRIADALWDTGKIRPDLTAADAFRADRLPPDLEGEGLLSLHRRAADMDLYFLSHQREEPREIRCAFRVSGMIPELWDPETGAIRPLPDHREIDGRIVIPLRFEPMQSWFVVFRKGATPPIPSGARNFADTHPLRDLGPGWQITFDPGRGGPPDPVAVGRLQDWSTDPDPRVRYYSGTAIYRKTFAIAPDEMPRPDDSLLLDLGQVEVMARVRLNGVDCGTAWKPPYRVPIGPAARPGENALEIEVVNLWINRMIGDEQLPDDGNWKDFETLLEWPEWFLRGKPRPSGRLTFTTCRHYRKDSPLAPSGLLGPVTLEIRRSAAAHAARGATPERSVR